MTGIDHDVVVAGDGPAAAAMVHAARERGLDAVAVGSSASWPHTYALWRDEVPDLPDDCFARQTSGAIVRGRGDREVDRGYAVVDNDRLRAHLGLDHALRHGWVERMAELGDRAQAHLADGDVLTSRWLVDATGAVGVPTAWQTAYGVIVSAADLERSGFRTDRATVMAWLPEPDPPAFVYAVPVAAGWLVEVTTLAASPAIEPQVLRLHLVSVLGAAVVEAAEALGRHESVRIPMGGIDAPGAGGRVVPFGVAGAIGHPTSGYSLAGVLQAAPEFASAMADGRDPVAAWWSSARRRTRRLHHTGLEILLRLDRDETIAFFDAFFSLPEATWGRYLDVAATPAEVAAAMRAVFSASPWSVRRRLLGVGPRLLGDLLRP